MRIKIRRNEILVFFHLFNFYLFVRNQILMKFLFLIFQRPPSSSLSYGGPMNDDVRSPGSQSTPGPLSAQPPPGLDTDPGESFIID